MKSMKRAALDGVELEYEIRGSGEPIVLVHHGAGADWFDPLCEEPSLSARYPVPATRPQPSTPFFEGRAARSTVRSWKKQFPVPSSRR